MERKIHPIIKAMIPVAEGIAKTFGKNCEVVVHEINNKRKGIVEIYNGHVSGRTNDGPMMEIGIQALSQEDGVKNIVNYSNKSCNGKALKSSTMFIRDENEEIIGAMCINMDVSEFIVVQNVLENLIQTDVKDQVNITNTTNNINDVLINIVKDILDDFGKPVAYMNKEEKVNIVKSLDEQGAFLIKGAIDYVAKILCVSRYTIYNYLDEIRVNI
ncbi:PAS domain-containing protein [Serpentinicella sp. ANB-PHB4]|uniref:helix-turn-helix transcriptional regulator n=1 Tax=Serpentinicella sp. ANB-PHB4 TaxID=3074076 RepID=UPI00285AF866|nr:PAS domain-containing protein [Serpentinicella sp. ANB-PHB4]MDR5658047.1 PAS domain-containing protein [Serpentinicella sp. ANB-PHB4]